MLLEISPLESRCLKLITETALIRELPRRIGSRIIQDLLLNDRRRVIEDAPRPPHYQPLHLPVLCMRQGDASQGHNTAGFKAVLRLVLLLLAIVVVVMVVIFRMIVMA